MGNTITKNIVGNPNSENSTQNSPDINLQSVFGNVNSNISNNLRLYPYAIFEQAKNIYIDIEYFLLVIPS